MNKYPKVILLLSFLLLQACASSTKQGIAPVPVEDRTVQNNQGDVEDYPSQGENEAKMSASQSSRDRKTARKNTDGQAVVVALLEDAEASLGKGDNESAAATLERALRLQPKNAMLWHRLGLLRLQQRNWQQAINLAKKSNSLAAGDYDLQSANWKLIAQANSRAGDKNAAKLATDTAIRLEQM